LWEILMRVAVIPIASSKSAALAALAAAFASGLEAAGHRPEIIDPAEGLARLASFDYIVIGAEPEGAFGKIPSRIKSLLKQAYGLEGKRSYAFVRKAGFRPAAALSKLMSAMEAEGMRVNDAEILASPEGAKEAGRSAPAERA
jgi:hypothetical protein